MKLSTLQQQIYIIIYYSFGCSCYTKILWITYFYGSNVDAQAVDKSVDCFVTTCAKVTLLFLSTAYTQGLRRFPTGKTTYHDTTFGDPYGSLYTSGKWIFPGNIQP